MEHCYTIKMLHGDLPGGPGVKNLPADMGDRGSIPGLEHSTCCRAAKLMPQGCWDSGAHAVQHEEPQWEALAAQPETAPQQQKASTAKANVLFFFFLNKT